MSLSELTGPSAAAFEPMSTEAEIRIAKTNKGALEFMFGTQKMMLEEFVFVSNEMLERTRTELHLLSEFISKMAGAHSVKDVKTMYEECGQHQIDFVRRDCDRLFKHGEHLIEATSTLFKRSQN
jgi:hypothetical protein